MEDSIVWESGAVSFNLLFNLEFYFCFAFNISVPASSKRFFLTPDRLFASFSWDFSTSSLFESQAEMIPFVFLFIFSWFGFSGLKTSAAYYPLASWLLTDEFNFACLASIVPILSIDFEAPWLILGRKEDPYASGLWESLRIRTSGLLNPLFIAETLLV